MPAEPRVSLEPDGRMLVRDAAPFKERWSWALYDFSNTIFSMNVVTLYFAVWIVTEKGASNTAYSLATSLSSVAVLVLAPWIGAVSDASGRRKPWVVGLTLVCVAATLAFSPIARAGLPVRTGLFALLAAFAVANTAYQLALPPYNALLPELVAPAQRGKLSGLGTAVGYVGSIAGVLMGATAVTGGLGLSAGGRVASFIPTALLFLLFSLPFFFFCRDHLARPRSETPRVRPRAIVRELAGTFRGARRRRGRLRLVFSAY